MQRAGYRTAHVGKYLNAYRYAVDDPAEPAPGWDQWHTFLDPTSYYSAPYSDNGRLRESGTRPSRAHHRDHQPHGRRDGPALRPAQATALHGRRPVRAASLRRALAGRALRRARPRAAGPRRRGVRRRAAPPPALLQRGRRRRQARLHPRPRAVRRGAARGPRAQLRVLAGRRCAASTAGSGGSGGRSGAPASAATRRSSSPPTTGCYFGEHRLSFEKTVPYRESVEVPLAMRLPGARGGADGRPARRQRRPPGDDPRPGRCGPLRSDPAAAGSSTGARCSTWPRARPPGWPADRAIPLELDTDGRPADAFTPLRLPGPPHGRGDLPAPHRRRRGPTAAARRSTSPSTTTSVPTPAS